MCVYDFLKENDFAPFPRHQIQSFAAQLLGSVACKPPPIHCCVAYLAKLRSSVLHELHLVHTDLKPENILLVQNDYQFVNVPVPGKVSLLIHCVCRSSLTHTILQRNVPPRAKKVLDSTEIRLIDFGSATFEEEYHSSVVSTRHYRAPEIILGENSLCCGLCDVVTHMLIRAWLVLSLRRFLARMHSGRVLHRRGALPNARQP